MFKLYHKCVRVETSYTLQGWSLELFKVWYKVVCTIDNKDPLRYKGRWYLRSNPVTSHLCYWELQYRLSVCSVVILADFCCLHYCRSCSRYALLNRQTWHKRKRLGWRKATTNNSFQYWKRKTWGATLHSILTPKQASRWWDSTHKWTPLIRVHEALLPCCWQSQCSHRCPFLRRGCLLENIITIIIQPYWRQWRAEKKPYCEIHVQFIILNCLLHK